MNVRRFELLARILEARDDAMVCADWLQTQGDPLGELIAVQVEIARTISHTPMVKQVKTLRDAWPGVQIAARAKKESAEWS